MGPITLWANNPYADGTVFTFPEGDNQLTRSPLVYTKSPKDRTYTVSQGDDLWTISYNAYGNSKWYWVIQEVNAYLSAIDITMGDVIIIPDLDYLFAHQPTTNVTN